MNYQPELGQALFGQPTEDYEMPRFAVSMFDGINYEVERVYWNERQEKFSDWMQADFGPVHFRPYNWNGDVDAGANFWIDGHDLRIRWYKHVGRGMSCNKIMTADEWAAWHDLVMDALRKHDDEEDEQR